MAATNIGVGTAVIVKANLDTPTTYVFDTTALTLLQNYAVAAGASVLSQKGTAIPIISLSSATKIDSFNLFIRTTADGSNADTWELHLMPVWLTPTAPLSALTPLLYHIYGFQKDGTKVLSRTQPASTSTVNSLIHVSVGATGTLISGGGSEVSVADPMYMALVAPYLAISLLADSNDEITINTLRVWGKRRPANE